MNRFEPPEPPEPPKGMTCDWCNKCHITPDQKSKYGWCDYCNDWVLLEEYVSNLDCDWEL